MDLRLEDGKWSCPPREVDDPDLTLSGSVRGPWVDAECQRLPRYGISPTLGFSDRLGMGFRVLYLVPGRDAELDNDDDAGAGDGAVVAE